MHTNTVYITGAGSGIGLWFVRHYLAAGQRVVGINRSFKAELLQELAPYAERFSHYLCDVSDEARVQQVMQQAVAKHGRPDLVIHSAGIHIGGPFESISAADFDQVLRINLSGSRHVAAALLPQMHSGSQLVMIASMAGLVPTYGYAAYNASKFGLVGLAGALYLEYLPRGILVSTVCPPEVDTPMVALEAQSMHPATRAMKAMAPTLTLDQAGNEMLNHIARRQRLIVLGRSTRMTYRLYRWFPELLLRVVNHKIRQVLATLRH
jgi:3-dehydrosphinganine reductase